MATGLLPATNIVSGFMFFIYLHSANSAVCLAQREFKDQYFDSPHFDLTLRDVWLRKRKGCWELKCPVSADKTEETGRDQTKVVAAALCTRYKEITDLPEIQHRVREELYGDGGRSSSAEDESWLNEMNLRCFAEFTTVRRSFTLEEDGVQVDVDQADFGYSVGEIEVLIPEGGDVQSAMEKIIRTAQKLGELSVVDYPKHFKHTFNFNRNIVFVKFDMFFFSSKVLPVTSELKEK